MSAKVAILIPFFGDWPPWINFFVESCRSNSTIDWFVLSDRPAPENTARNVRHVRSTFGDYKALVSDALHIRFDPKEAYKICDIRPALPFIHSDLLEGYDFAGFGDLDVIYGDLRAFYDGNLLSNYDLLSSHSNRVSGHLCLMRNSEEMVTAFRRAPRWKKVFERPENVGFDEAAFFNVFHGRRAKFGRSIGRKGPRCFFREAYSTPAPVERMRWYWSNGCLTNEFYPFHQFMYLHFMSWHSNRWYADQPGVAASAPAPWSLLPRTVQMDWRDARDQGFMVSPAGIQPVDLSPSR